MNNKLKKLVWKKINKEEELEELRKKWFKKWEETYDLRKPMSFLFYNAEQIAKEKQEILNKQTEYNKQDMIDMFVEAGLEYTDGEYRYLKIKDDSHRKKIIIESARLYFEFDFNGVVFETRWLDFKDRESIEFYYNIFRNILEFEVINNEE